MEKNKVKGIQRNGQGGILSYCQDDRRTFEKDMKGLRELYRYLGEEHSKQRKDKSKGPEVEACLEGSGNRLEARMHVI